MSAPTPPYRLTVQNAAMRFGWECHLCPEREEGTFMLRSACKASAGSHQLVAHSDPSEPCCDGGPPGHTEQQHHDASPCYDQSCRLDHPKGGPFPHPCDAAS